MSTGRKAVRWVEKGLTRGIKASRSLLRGVAEVLDETPKAIERIGAEIESALEEADKATVDAKDAEGDTLSHEAPDREP